MSAVLDATAREGGNATSISSLSAAVPSAVDVTDPHPTSMAVVELLRQSLQLVSSSPPSSPRTSATASLAPDAPPPSLAGLSCTDSGPLTDTEQQLLAAAAASGEEHGGAGVAPLLPQSLVEESGVGKTTEAAAKGSTLLSAAVRQRLDAGALLALAELETAEADAIALRLEQAGANVRNPSAYVHRAVNNARRRVGAPAQGAGNQHLLDQSARAALAELPTEAAQAILDELSSKGAGVRNPSAYVVKAVGNARRGEQVGVPQPTAYLQQPQRHRAEPALAFAASARRQPSPFGLGVAPPRPRPQSRFVAAASPPGPPAEPDATWQHFSSENNWMSPEYVHLDPKAAAALAALPPPHASQIVAELQRKRAAIRNPSAYVMRATANAHAGQLPNAFQQQQQQPPPNLPAAPASPHRLHQPRSPLPVVSYLQRQQQQQLQPPPLPHFGPPGGVFSRALPSAISEAHPNHACS